MTITADPAARAALEGKRGLADVKRRYAVEGVDLRAADDPASTLVNFYGHASVTDKGYDLYGGPEKGGFTEFVDRGAFKKTLGDNPDVVFKVNHDGLPLARSNKSLTLTLAEDKVGLEARAKLDTRISVVNDIVLLMDAGILDEMSFAFRVRNQHWLDAEGEEVAWWDLAGVERHITEVDLHKGDVSIVTYGANPHTDASLRSLDEVVRELTADVDNLDQEQLRTVIAHLQSLTTIEDDEAERALAHATTEAARRAFLARHTA